jgi:hypothetical protein
MPARISMTKKQREALLALPETENEVVRHYTLDANRSRTRSSRCMTATVVIADNFIVFAEKDGL